MSLSISFLQISLLNAYGKNSRIPGYFSKIIAKRHTDELILQKWIFSL